MKSGAVLSPLLFITTNGCANAKIKKEYNWLTPLNTRQNNRCASAVDLALFEANEEELSNNLQMVISTKRNSIDWK